MSAIPKRTVGLRKPQDVLCGCLGEALASLRPGAIWRLERAGVEKAEETFTEIMRDIEVEVTGCADEHAVPDILQRVSAKVRNFEMGQTRFPAPVCSVAAEALRRFYGTHEAAEEICNDLRIPSAQLCAFRMSIRRSWRG